MKQKRHSVEEVIRILREADRGEGTIEEVCRQHNIAPWGDGNRNVELIINEGVFQSGR